MPPPPSVPSPSPDEDPIRAELAQTVYIQLHAIAQRQMSQERRGHTLSATALVNEAYLRLGDHDLIRAQGRGVFLMAAAQAMRRILIERARARGRIKRGGGAARISLDMIGDVVDLDTDDDGRAELAIAFDEAFGRLEEEAPRVADVVRLRFYAGLSVPEAAEALGVSPRSVNNLWAYARAWIARELRQGDLSPGTDTELGPAPE